MPDLAAEINLEPEPPPPTPPTLRPVDKMTPGDKLLGSSMPDPAAEINVEPEPLPPPTPPTLKPVDKMTPDERRRAAFSHVVAQLRLKISEGKRYMYKEASAACRDEFHITNRDFRLMWPQARDKARGRQPRPSPVTPRQRTVSKPSADRQ